MGIKHYEIYDKVTPDPSIETVEAIKKEYDGKEPLDQAAEVIMQDHTHLDNNPIPITRDNVIYCLEEITKVNPLA